MFNTDLHEWKHEWQSDHTAGNINRVEERLQQRLSKFDVTFHRINHELGKRNNHDCDHWVNCWRTYLVISYIFSIYVLLNLY